MNEYVSGAISAPKTLERKRMKKNGLVCFLTIVLILIVSVAGCGKELSVEYVEPAKRFSGPLGGIELVDSEKTYKDLAYDIQDWSAEFDPPRGDRMAYVKLDIRKKWYEHLQKNLVNNEKYIIDEQLFTNAFEKQYGLLTKQNTPLENFLEHKDR